MKDDLLLFAIIITIIFFMWIMNGNAQKDLKRCEEMYVNPHQIEYCQLSILKGL